MKPYFDGEPSTFRQMRALFPAESTLHQKPEWTAPVDRKFRLTRICQSLEQWYAKHGRRKRA